MKYLILFVAIFGWASCATVTQPDKKKPLGDEERAALYVRVANGALAEGDPTGALANLMEAERLDSSNPHVYHSMAIAYFRKHDLGEAIRNAEKAVELAPEFSPANNTLGKLFLDAGQFDRAKPHLLKAAKDPLYRDAYKSRTNLGILYYQKGDFDTSNANLEIAIRDAPRLACVAHYYRGHISLKRERFSRAAREYRLATKNLCARFTDAHYSVGIALLKDGQYKAAKKKFLEITQLFPDTEVSERAVKQLRTIP